MINTNSGGWFYLVERGEGEEERNSEDMNHLVIICFLNLVILDLYEQRGPEDDS